MKQFSFTLCFVNILIEGTIIEAVLTYIHYFVNTFKLYTNILPSAILLKMSLFMRVDVTPLSKSLVTNTTGVRLLTSVGAQVNSQVALSREFLATSAAFNTLCRMHGFVLLQVVIADEPSLTNVASKPFHLAVARLMCAQAICTREAQTTYTAEELLLFVVLVLVLLHRVTADKLLAANIALEQLGFQL